jgi:hypothetical protein
MVPTIFMPTFSPALEACFCNGEKNKDALNHELLKMDLITSDLSLYPSSDEKDACTGRQPRLFFLKVECLSVSSSLIRYQSYYWKTGPSPRSCQKKIYCVLVSRKESCILFWEYNRTGQVGQMHFCSTLPFQSDPFTKKYFHWSLQK